MADTSTVLTVPYKFTPRPYQLEMFRALDGELPSKAVRLKCQTK